MELTLEQAWSNGTGRGVVRVAVETTVPLKTLRACPRILIRLPGADASHASCHGGAAESLRAAVRAIRFIEATGARPSKARTLFPRRWIENPPDGLDHTLVWRDRNGVLFLTTEPYAPPPACAWDDYAHVDLPEGMGMWNPPYTTLYLLAKPEHHANLVRLRNDLLD